MVADPKEKLSPEELEVEEKAKAEAEAAKVKAESPPPKEDKEEDETSEWVTELKGFGMSDELIAQVLESRNKNLSGLLRTLEAQKGTIKGMKKEKTDAAAEAEKQQKLKEGKHLEVIAEQAAQLTELGLEVVAGQERIKTVESLLNEVAEVRMKEVKMKPAMRELVEAMPPEERIPFLNKHADELKMKKIPVTPEEREAAGMSDKDRKARTVTAASQF